MKIISTNSEIKAIVSICDGSVEVRDSLLSKLQNSHFGYEPAKAIFKRIHQLSQDGKSIPRCEQFCEDVTLNEESKILLKGKKRSGVKKDQIDDLVRVLEEHRKLRVISSSLTDATKVLTGKGPKHVDKIAQKLIKRLGKIESYDDLNVSSSDNCVELLDQILEGERSIVPTGIEAFDKINGGIPDGQVAILAADSGGGKSAFAIQLAINQYFSSYNTLILSMEMTEEEIWSRVWSNLAGVQHDKFILKQFTKKDKNKIQKVAQKFHKFGAKEGCRFQVVCPTSDRKFSELIYFIKRRKPDIVYIDYISLLKPENDRVQKHEQLGEITRLAKKAAVQLNIPIVLLAQLNKEEQVKYSGAINENSGLTIQWTYGKGKNGLSDNRDVRGETVEMSITKARNQRRFTFNVSTEFQFMRFGDADAPDSSSKDTKLKQRGVKKESQKIDL